MSEPLGFEDAIKPLFRTEDRESMLGTFDLWELDDVRENADAILDRIEDGSMPCDTTWTEEQIELLRGWIEAGMPA